MNKNYITVLIKIYNKFWNSYKYELFETYKNKNGDNLQNKIDMRINFIKNNLADDDNFTIEYELFDYIKKLEDCVITSNIELSDDSDEESNI